MSPAQARTLKLCGVLVLGALGLLGSCQVPPFQFEGYSTCDDGEQSGDETDVDCGGGCDPCGLGAACQLSGDCQSAQCLDGRCVEISCDDRQRGTSETDVDCGGPVCPACDLGAACDTGVDCQIGICTEARCQASHCVNQTPDEAEGETDVDCGGPMCKRCGVNQRCLGAGDCMSGVCIGAACEAPTCVDAVANGNETDVDCGGLDCEPCGLGQGCIVDDDCENQNCVANRCSEEDLSGAGGTAGSAGEPGVGGATPAAGGTSGGTLAEAGSDQSAAGAIEGGAAGAGGAAGEAAGGDTAAGGTLPDAGAPPMSSAGAPSAGEAGSMSAAGSGGSPPVVGPDETCSGCARLSVPLSEANTRTPYIIYLTGANMGLDMSAASVTFRVSVYAGTNGAIQLFAQNPENLNYEQERNFISFNQITGFQDLVLNLSNPSNGNFDNTMVQAVGLEVHAGSTGPWTNPTIVYVDSIALSNAAELGLGPWGFDNDYAPLKMNADATPVDGSSIVFLGP